MRATGSSLTLARRTRAVSGACGAKARRGTGRTSGPDATETVVSEAGDTGDEDPADLVGEGAPTSPDTPTSAEYRFSRVLGFDWGEVGLVGDAGMGLSVGVCGVRGVVGVWGVCRVFPVSVDASDKLDEAESTGEGNSEPGSGSNGWKFIINVRLGTGAVSEAMVLGGVDSGDDADVDAEADPSADTDDSDDTGDGGDAMALAADTGDARIVKSGITSGDAGGCADSAHFLGSSATGHSVSGTCDSSGDSPIDAWRSLGSESSDSCFSSSTSL